jgi:hypothetical protein
VRQSVIDLVVLGPFPLERDAAEDHLAELEKRLHAIERPVSREEAFLLATAFGPDGNDSCFGLAWTLLHLIETAPAGTTAELTGEGGWVTRLSERAARGH